MITLVDWALYGLYFAAILGGFSIVGLAAIFADRCGMLS